MDVIDKLMGMQAGGWTWKAYGGRLANANVVVTARKSPWGRMYGYGDTVEIAFERMEAMITERLEELITNGVFCPVCKGTGRIVPVKSNSSDTCRECGGDGKGPYEKEREKVNRNKGDKYHETDNSTV